MFDLSRMRFVLTAFIERCLNADEFGLSFIFNLVLKYNMQKSLKKLTFLRVDFRIRFIELISSSPTWPKMGRRNEISASEHQEDKKSTYIFTNRYPILRSSFSASCALIALSVMGYVPDLPTLINLYASNSGLFKSWWNRCTTEILPEFLFSVFFVLPDYFLISPAYTNREESLDLALTFTIKAKSWITFDLWRRDEYM